MLKKNIWYEKLYKDFGQYLTIDKILYQCNTGKQNLFIFKNKFFGKIMALDEILQTTELDEFIYHEMISHVPLISHNNVKNVLLIGGGDGGVLREIVKYKDVEQITMVEIDSNVIDICKKYLPNHNAGSFKDPRLRLVISDGMDFLSQHKEKFDIIISDCTDPVSIGKKLFTSDFYRECASHLNKDGIFVSQNGVCFIQQDELINSYRKLNKFFSDVRFYRVTIPTYYGGVMNFSWASHDYKLYQFNINNLTKKINNMKLVCRYYNAYIHCSSFVLPQYLLNILSL